MHKKIDKSNYQVEKGDLIIMASYPKIENEAKNFAMKLSRIKIPAVAVFNLRKSGNEDDIIKEGNLYMNYKENIDIDYIEEQCNQFKNEHFFVIIIEDNEKIKCTNENLSSRLKKLGQDLGAMVFVLCDLKESITSKEYPTLEDIKNQELIEYADTIWLIDNDRCFIAKNAYGDVEIVDSDNTDEK